MRTRAGLTFGCACLLIAGCSSTPTPHAAPATRTPSSSPSTAPPSPRAGAPRVSAQVLPWHLPAPLSRAVAMPFAGGALLAGGLQAGDHSTDQVLTIDLGSGPHGPVGRLQEPLHDSAGAALHGRPTVVGGGGATELSVVQQRDPSGRWRVVGHLSGARSDLSVLPTSSSLLVIGGYDGATTPRTDLRTTDGTHFTASGQLPEGIRYAGIATDGHTGWIVGGERSGQELDEVLKVDLSTGHVRRVGRLPHPLGHEAVAVVGDRLLIAGGRRSPDQVTGRMWWWRPGSSSWAAAGQLPYPVADAGVVSQGNRLYLFGGETPSFTDRVTRLSWR